MYIAMHTLVYADDPEAARAFFRDVLEWPHVDTGGGWLIFKSGPSELGVHPTDDGEGWSTPQERLATREATSRPRMTPPVRWTIKRVRACSSSPR